MALSVYREELFKGVSRGLPGWRFVVFLMALGAFLVGQGGMVGAVGQAVLSPQNNGAFVDVDTVMVQVPHGDEADNLPCDDSDCHISCSSQCHTGCVSFFVMASAFSHALFPLASPLPGFKAAAFLTPFLFREPEPPRTRLT